jgi:transcriptional regulator GlxA family with amidase domain
MRVAIVAYAGFNELDIFANLHILNRTRRVNPQAAITAELVSPSRTLTSMYGVEVATAGPLSSVRDADAVLIGSGGIPDALEDEAFLAELHLDRARQLIGSQCSGALILQRLGLLNHQPACTDAVFRPRLEALGVTVLDRPFHSHDNVGTAGGCLSAAHLSAWFITRLLGAETAAATLKTVAPVGQEAGFVANVLGGISGPEVETATRIAADQRPPHG